MNRITAMFMGALLLAANAIAQDTTHSFSSSQQEHMAEPGMNFFFQNNPGQQARTAFVMTEMTANEETVANAPYSATAVEETTQVLSDGNRIVNKSSDFVARDSQGRTRRESTLNRIGGMPTESSKMIFINDPTTHMRYVMHDGASTKVMKTEGAGSPMIINMDENSHGMMKQKMMGSHMQMKIEDNNDQTKQVKHEDLGMQTIEGVSAEGKRETTTIAAGAVGNERPIEIVSETWYSPDLHTTVLRKHSDPRVGETVFRLTDIKRSEPDASLFQPPANVKTLKNGPVIELKREPSPKE